MNKHEFIEYLHNNFNLSPECHRIINNILNRAEGMEPAIQYCYLSDLLDGIGLSDNELLQVEF